MKINQYFIRRFSAIAILFGHTLAFAQSNDDLKTRLDELNRAIDRAVVQTDLEFLHKHYADDFVFTHGTGDLDSKESWIKAISNMGGVRYLSREHDSTAVELHGNVAILTGKLKVVRLSPDDERSELNLRYVRVFALRNDVWQMISHKTTQFE